MFYLLNNCRNVDHLRLYSGRAFFDLWVSDREDALAMEIRPGDTCWVASYKGTGKAGRNDVVLSKYTFSGTRRVPTSDAPSNEIWILDGTLEYQVVLPKSGAAAHSSCHRLFDKRGHFKQVSFLRGA